MITKAVVLCAGEGTRLRPLTLSRPKHLLPIAGRPILGWVLESIVQAGIREVGLVVGYQAEAIRRYVGSGEAWGLSVAYLTQSQLLGLGHAVALAEDYVAGEPFLVYLGDNLLERGITDFVTAAAGRQWDAAVLLKPVADPQRFGVAEVEGDRAIKVEEKPQIPGSNLAVVGVYVFRSTIFGAIRRLQPSKRGEIELTEAIQLLIAEGRYVWAGQVEGEWEDAGEPASVLRANAQWLGRLAPELRGTLERCHVEGPVTVGEGSRVSDSRLVGPCRIGRNCAVTGAVLGPGVSVEDGCEIVSARLRNCIVQQHSRVGQIPQGLEGSVLGQGVEIWGSAQADGQAPVRMLLGDEARVRVLEEVA